ncbi:hypothetical protein GQ600_5924 [Phytophthora cactorum]|nr:hypothetical protein GQ600_5924 [Phytophthora cactorum]
MQLSGPPTS